jgi:molybdenum cofactor biosynthesis enzyme MoaA
MKIMNKHIHEDEFRLRILVTNQCDKGCHFCLNDFQPKEPSLFINPFEAGDCIRAYGEFMRTKPRNEKSIVTFSGGEPGIHGMLGLMLIYAKHYCDVVKVVTNGAALEPKFVPAVDHWHVGVTSVDDKVINFLQYTKNILVQIVVTDQMSLKDLINLIEPYNNHDIKVKLFSDFFSKNQKDLADKIYAIMNLFEDGEVTTRFTGKQINRGYACAGCDKQCVTLKALWLFPDGTSSTCPQGVKEKYDDDSWDETVEKAYNAHMHKEIKHANAN